MSKYPINDEWSIYYQTLEYIRRSGITNMWGAAPYLAEYRDIPKTLASEVLLSWIENYDELSKKFSWR